MTPCRSATALLVMAALGGCAHAPAPDQLLSSSELSGLVTDRTLYVPCPSNPADGTLLYLASNGTGWLDSRMMPGYPPGPGGMSIVFDWRVAEDSRVCFWATPRIGDIPSFAPAFSECVQVLRSRATPGSLKAVVTQDCKVCTGWLSLHSPSAFPQPVIDQYLAQMRVLYGGQIPAWTVSQPVRSLQ